MQAHVSTRGDHASSRHASSRQPEASPPDTQEVRGQRIQGVSHLPHVPATNAFHSTTPPPDVPYQGQNLRQLASAKASNIEASRQLSTEASRQLSTSVPWLVQEVCRVCAEHVSCAPECAREHVDTAAPFHAFSSTRKVQQSISHGRRAELPRAMTRP